MNTYSWHSEVFISGTVFLFVRFMWRLVCLQNRSYMCSAKHCKVSQNHAEERTLMLYFPEACIKLANYTSCRCSSASSNWIEGPTQEPSTALALHIAFRDDQSFVRSLLPFLGKHVLHLAFKSYYWFCCQRSLFVKACSEKLVPW